MVPVVASVNVPVWVSVFLSGSILFIVLVCPYVCARVFVSVCVLGGCVSECMRLCMPWGMYNAAAMKKSVIYTLAQFLQPLWGYGVSFASAKTLAKYIYLSFSGVLIFIIASLRCYRGPRFVKGNASGQFSFSAFTLLHVLQLNATTHASLTPITSITYTGSI